MLVLALHLNYASSRMLLFFNMLLCCFLHGRQTNHFLRNNICVGTLPSNYLFVSHKPHTISWIRHWDFSILLNFIMKMDILIADNIIIIRGIATGVTTRIIYGNTCIYL